MFILLMINLDHNTGTCIYIPSKAICLRIHIRDILNLLTNKVTTFIQTSVISNGYLIIL